MFPHVSKFQLDTSLSVVTPSALVLFLAAILKTTGKTIKITLVSMLSSNLPRVHPSSSSDLLSRGRERNKKKKKKKERKQHKTNKGISLELLPKQFRRKSNQSLRLRLSLSLSPRCLFFSLMRSLVVRGENTPQA